MFRASQSTRKEEGGTGLRKRACFVFSYVFRASQSAREIIEEGTGLRSVPVVFFDVFVVRCKLCPRRAGT